MSWPNRWILLSAAAVSLYTALFLNLEAALANAVYDAHTRVDLVSPSVRAAPGETVWVGLRMRMDPEWHVYWRNPGDSGLPPTITWDLPADFMVGEIQWPYPKIITVPPLTTYAYEEEVILYTSIKIPSEFSGEEMIFKARANWLACRIECIPGRADLQLALSLSQEKGALDQQGLEAFERARRMWPTIDEGINIKVRDEGSAIVLQVAPAKRVQDGAEIYFFPYRSDIIDHAATQVLSRGDEGYVLSMAASSLRTAPLTSLEGILWNRDGWRNEASPSAILVHWQSPEPPASAASFGKTEARGGERGVSLTIFVACLFAFFGGLILNLMPCVLPVLSLKIMHLVQHASDQRRSVINGLVFGAGVIVSFWALVILLLLLRSLGAAIGWGFQFQSPAFVVLISLVLFIFAVNLFGVFEIGTGLTTLGGVSAGKKGYAASFGSGVLATIVATPCTAPFMGTALGFALSRTPLEAFLVFTFLGLGMALPVVVLSASPRLLKLVPKPGPWMNTLKIVLGFVLLATVVWLLWVLGLQRGVVAMSTLLSAMLFLAFGLYCYGKAQMSARPAPISLFLAVVFGVLGLSLSVAAARMDNPPSQTIPGNSRQGGGIAWQKFSPALMDELRAGNAPVFLDFTAAWCLSCQVNDRVALSDNRVVEAFRQRGVIAVKADWTNNDPDITAALAAYGRNSVPLYILYPGGGAEGVILPEILTPGIVLDHLQRHLKN